MLIKLIEYFVYQLVEDKEAVTIQEVSGADKILIEIRVAATDLAKVIGKEGKTFRALRSLVNSVDPEGKKDIVVDIIA